MRNIRWDLDCLPNDMIEQTRAENAAACLLELRLAHHEIKLLCTHPSGSYLARDWHIEGRGGALISEAGICLNARTLPPNSWIKHRLGIDSRQSTNTRPLPHLFRRWIHALGFFCRFFFFSKEYKSKWLSPNIMMLSKDGDNAVAGGNWEKLLFVVLQHEKT